MARIKPKQPPLFIKSVMNYVSRIVDIIFTTLSENARSHGADLRDIIFCLFTSLKFVFCRIGAHVPLFTIKKALPLNVSMF